MKNGGTLNLESQVRVDVVRDLALKGHKITENPGVHGGYKGIGSIGREVCCWVGRRVGRMGMRWEC